MDKDAVREGLRENEGRVGEDSSGPEEARDREDKAECATREG